MREISLADINFVSSNEHKHQEVQELLGSVSRIELDLDELQEIDLERIIRAKAAAAREKIPDKILLVEDTGLEFQAMGRLPGPFIKWFLKEMGRSGLSELAAGLPSNAATAITLAALSIPGEELFLAEGKVAGKIVPERGDIFGWDPVFEVDGTGRTYAEMDKQEKNSLSHRAKALEALKEKLKQAGIVLK